MRRRRFISLPLLAGFGALGRLLPAAYARDNAGATMSDGQERDNDFIRLFLCGDVMTGRGIDQILPHPGSPQLYEPYMSSAAHYVAIAERKNGRIPRQAPFDYVWGDALPVLDPANGRLVQMTMRVMQIRRFRLQRASEKDARWLAQVPDRESRKLGTHIGFEEDELRVSM